MEASAPKTEYIVISDITKLDFDVIHEYLSKESYWRKGITMDRMKKAMDSSKCFGVVLSSDGSLVGFARVVTDYITIAYLADVFILSSHRKLGLSKILLHHIMEDEELQQIQRWILLTADAHELYRKFGFENISSPYKYMEFTNPIPST